MCDMTDMFVFDSFGAFALSRSGQFPEGGSIAQLMVLALETDWAKKAHPWGIYLRMAYPKKVRRIGRRVRSRCRAERPCLFFECDPAVGGGLGWLAQVREVDDI